MIHLTKQHTTFIWRQWYVNSEILLQGFKGKTENIFVGPYNTILTFVIGWDNHMKTRIFICVHMFYRKWKSIRHFIQRNVILYKYLESKYPPCKCNSSNMKENVAKYIQNMFWEPFLIWLINLNWRFLLFRYQRWLYINEKVQLIWEMIGYFL